MAGIRTFIAVNITPEIIEKMAMVQTALRNAETAVQWARPDGLHLTLQFLGEVSEAHVPLIGQQLAKVIRTTKPFPITIAGVGAFPTMHHPRIVWAGVTEGAQALRALATKVEHAMRTLDFSPEEHPFTPHVTLGRVKSPRETALLLTRLAQYADQSFGVMIVREIAVMRSILSPAGAQYTPMRVLALDAPEVINASSSGDCDSADHTFSS